MSRRRAFSAAALLLVAIGVLLGLRGLGEDSPEQAVYALAHDLEHREADGVCERLFPSTLLPVTIARALDVPEGPRADPGKWEAERRACVREFGDRGEFESFEFHEPLVERVRFVAIRPQAGVSRAATAEVTIDRSRETVKLIEYRGGWKVVFEVR